MIMLKHLDHLVLTVADLERTIAFYTELLGCQCVTFGDNRKALTFGTQKINLHQQGQEIQPNAKQPTVSSADLCFIIDGDIQQAYRHLQKIGIALESSIVERTGALGNIQSIYLRDPDGNLIELSQYPTGES